MMIDSACGFDSLTGVLMFESVTDVTGIMVIMIVPSCADRMTDVDAMRVVTVVRPRPSAALTTDVD